MSIIICLIFQLKHDNAIEGSNKAKTTTSVIEEKLPLAVGKDSANEKMNSSTKENKSTDSKSHHRDRKSSRDDRHHSRGEKSSRSHRDNRHSSHRHKDDRDYRRDSKGKTMEKSSSSRSHHSSSSSKATSSHSHSSSDRRKSTDHRSSDNKHVHRQTSRDRSSKTGDSHKEKNSSQGKSLDKTVTHDHTKHKKEKESLENKALASKVSDEKAKETKKKIVPVMKLKEDDTFMQHLNKSAKNPLPKLKDGKQPNANLQETKSVSPIETKSVSPKETKSVSPILKKVEVPKVPLKVSPPIAKDKKKTVNKREKEKVASATIVPKKKSPVKKVIVSSSSSSSRSSRSGSSSSSSGSRSSSGSSRSSSGSSRSSSGSSRSSSGSSSRSSRSGSSSSSSGSDSESGSGSSSTSSSSEDEKLIKFKTTQKKVQEKLPNKKQAKELPVKAHEKLSNNKQMKELSTSVAVVTAKDAVFDKSKITLKQVTIPLFSVDDQVHSDSSKIKSPKLNKKFSPDKKASPFKDKQPLKKRKTYLEFGQLFPDSDSGEPDFEGFPSPVKSVKNKKVVTTFSKRPKQNVPLVKSIKNNKTKPSPNVIKKRASVVKPIKSGKNKTPAKPMKVSFFSKRNKQISALTEPAPASTSSDDEMNLPIIQFCQTINEHDFEGFEDSPPLNASIRPLTIYADQSQSSATYNEFPKQQTVVDTFSTTFLPSNYNFSSDDETTLNFVGFESNDGGNFIDNSKADRHHSTEQNNFESNCHKVGECSTNTKFEVTNTLQANNCTVFVENNSNKRKLSDSIVTTPVTTTCSNVPISRKKRILDAVQFELNEKLRKEQM